MLRYGLCAMLLAESEAACRPGLTSVGAAHVATARVVAGREADAGDEARAARSLAGRGGRHGLAKVDLALKQTLQGHVGVIKTGEGAGGNGSAGTGDEEQGR